MGRPHTILKPINKKQKFYYIYLFREWLTFFPISLKHHIKKKKSKFKWGKFYPHIPGSNPRAINYWTFKILMKKKEKSSQHITTKWAICKSFSMQNKTMLIRWHGQKKKVEEKYVTKNEKGQTRYLGWMFLFLDSITSNSILPFVWSMNYY